MVDDTHDTAQLKQQLQNVQQEMSSLKTQLHELKSQRQNSCRLAITVATNSVQPPMSPMNENTSVWSPAVDVDVATLELSSAVGLSKQRSKQIHKAVNKFVARLLRDSNTDYTTQGESTATKLTLDDISEQQQPRSASAPRHPRHHRLEAQFSSTPRRVSRVPGHREHLEQCVKELTYSGSHNASFSFQSPHQNTEILTDSETSRTSSINSTDTETELPSDLTFVISSSNDSALDSSCSSSSAPRSNISSLPGSTDTGFASIPPRPPCEGAETTQDEHSANTSSDEESDISGHSINSLDSDATTFFDGPLNREAITQKTSVTGAVFKHLCCVNKI